MPFSSDQYDSRPWYRKFSERWSTTLGYLMLAFAITLGFWAYGNVTEDADEAQQRDIVANELTITELCAEINTVVAGLRLFVDDLIQAGSNREAVLERLDARLPDDLACQDTTTPPETP